MRRIGAKGPGEDQPGRPSGHWLRRTDHCFDLNKPVFAAVNGLAIGGSLEIVLAGDIAIAGDTASFALPEPKIGLAAIGGGGLQRLALQIPIKHALDLILTGRRIGADEASTIGLVSCVVPFADLMTAAREIAAEICRGSPMAMAAWRSVARKTDDAASLKDALSAHYPEVVEPFESGDARERQAAFRDKRAPIWTGH